MSSLSDAKRSKHVARNAMDAAYKSYKANPCSLTREALSTSQNVYEHTHEDLKAAEVRIEDMRDSGKAF